MYSSTLNRVILDAVLRELLHHSRFVVFLVVLHATGTATLW